MPRPAFLVALLLGLAVLGPVSFAQAPVPTGTWTGTLTPHNHPTMHLPMTYQVEECAEGITITLASGDGQGVEARDVRATAERIRFAFTEPEANTPLGCDLRRQQDGAFTGRCTAPDGTYATFAMNPPSSSMIGCSE